MSSSSDGCLVDPAAKDDVRGESFLHLFPVVSLNASESQWETWRKWFKEKGYTFVQFAERYSSSVTHIVVEGSVTKENLEMFVRRKNGDKLVPFAALQAMHKIVKSSWITDSICSRALVDISVAAYPYTVEAPTQQASSNIIKGSSSSSSSSKRSFTITSPHSDRVVHNGGSFFCAMPKAPTEGGGPGQQSRTKTNALPVNLKIAEQLDLLADYLELDSKNCWKQAAYRKTAKELRNMARSITLDNLDEVLRSSSQKDHVESFLRTGKCEALETMKGCVKLQAMFELKQVWGVGPWTAKKLVETHLIYSVEDLRKEVKKTPKILNLQQHIGLNRFEDLQERIPREEVDEIFALICAEAQRIVPGIEAQVCGSYRRGAASCGDMDILFSPPSGKTYVVDFLNQLIQRLDSHGTGLLTDHLCLPDSKPDYSNNPRSKKPRTSSSSKLPAVDSGGSDCDEDVEEVGNKVQSYMGVCRLPGRLCRRVDMKVFTRQMYPFALLYFTGSAYFNRSMRRLAGCLDMRLSEKALVKCCVRHVDGSRTKDAIPGGEILCHSEEDIFKALGIPYRAPKDRMDDVTVYDLEPTVKLDDSYDSDLD